MLAGTSGWREVAGVSADVSSPYDAELIDDIARQTANDEICLGRTMVTNDVGLGGIGETGESRIVGRCAERWPGLAPAIVIGAGFAGSDALRAAEVTECRCRMAWTWMCVALAFGRAAGGIGVKGGGSSIPLGDSLVIGTPAEHRIPAGGDMWGVTDHSWEGDLCWRRAPE